MISNKGTKIASIWKCRKCGRVQYFFARGRHPTRCYMYKVCSGKMKRVS